MTEKTNTHTPIFLAEIKALLKENQLKRVIDGTFGEGGHGISLAREGFKVLGLEWDDAMFQLTSTKLKSEPELGVKLVRGNYADVSKLATEADFAPADAVILDLGLSLYQLYYSDRGFSLKRDEPLDLRISKDLKLTAAEFLNRASEDELTATIGKLIEDRIARKLVIALAVYRRAHEFKSIEDLRLVVENLQSTDQERHKLMRKILQALRIIINDEFGNIESSFSGSLSILKSGGLLIYLTYHSLEDRLVKRLGRGNQDVREYQKALLNKEYPFATSAKLRVYEKI